LEGQAVGLMFSKSEVTKYPKNKGILLSTANKLDQFYLRLITMTGIIEQYLGYYR